MKTKDLFKIDVPQQKKTTLVRYHDHNSYYDERKVICIFDMFQWSDRDGKRLRGHIDLVQIELEQAEEFAEKLLEHVRKIKQEEQLFGTL